MNQIRDPELAEARRRDRPLIAIVILGLLIIGAIGVSAATYGRSNSGAKASKAAEENTRIAQQNTARTECIRAISNELDHAHWSLIGKAFNTTSRDEAHAIGQKLNNLPLVVDIAERGGSILKTHFDPCPPVPTAKELP